ncbi:GntR family transcriptional regulator (plasmid) [Brevundimonas staleyi]|uniref:GntR family transcriptional regulator n=1 Tax=Brevundimonas staleyi TaxID=74326 RepID=A0ABW0FNH3_9CAUL
MAARQSVNERVYAAIKAQILDGAFSPGEHLDAALLGQQHNASLTPVQTALNRLVGERILEKYAKDGFFLPRVTPHLLRAQYRWVWSLLLEGVRTPPTAKLEADPRIAADIGEREPDDLLGAVDRLFLRIGALSGSLEVHWALQNANERMRPVRRLEGERIGDRDSELHALSVSLLRDDRPRLEEGLEAYFRRRDRLVTDLVLLSLHTGERRPPPDRIQADADD